MIAYFLVMNNKRCSIKAIKRRSPSARLLDTKGIDVSSESPSMYVRQLTIGLRIC